MNVRLSRTALAAATRRAGVRLPFPLSDDAVAVTAEADTAAELTPALWALESPRMVVYGVLRFERADGTFRVAAVEGGTNDTGMRHGDYAFETTGSDAAVYDVAPQRLVQTVVGAAAEAGATTDEPLLARDRVTTVAGLATEPGFDAGRPRVTGVLGVVDLTGDRPRHSRSVTWRVYATGGVLAVELPPRVSRPRSVALQAPSERNLTRACLDVITGLNHASEASHV